MAGAPVARLRLHMKLWLLYTYRHLMQESVGFNYASLHGTAQPPGKLEDIWQFNCHS